MKSSIITTTADSISSGGTITGDVTIDGDLTVNGGGGFSYSEVLTGDIIIDQDANAKALTIDSQSADHHVLFIDAPVTAGASVIRIDSAGALTTGHLFNANITSTALATTANDGAFKIVHSADSDTNTNNLMYLHNDHADSTGTTVLKLQQDSTGYALNAVSAADADVTVANFQSAIDANGEHSIIRVGHSSKAAYMGLLLNSADTAYFGIDDNPDDGNGIYVNESGQIGIGTKAPSSLLHVTSSTADGHIIAESTHAGSNGVVDIRSVADRDSVIHFREGTTVKARIKNDASADALVLTDGADSNTVFIKSNKMGIGTDSPQASLHVESDLRHAWDNNETDLLKVGQAGTDSGFVVWSSGGNGEVYLGNLYNDDAGDINFVTKASVDDNNVKMKIEGGGNVGIGTTSPAVSGGLGLDIEDNTASGGSKGGSLRLGSNDGSAVAQNDRLGVINFCGAEDSSGTMTEGARIDAIADAGWSATENGADLRFFTTDGNASDTEKMRITAEGYVGIGCNPTQDLEIKMATDKHMMFSDSQSETGYCPTIHAVNTAGSNNVELGFRASELRFVTGSAKRMVLDDNSRISLSNNDSNTGNTVFGKSAWNNSSDNASDYNTIFGEGIMGTGAVAGATYNTGVGFDALKNLTAGDYNVAIGALALDAVAVGESYNVAIGLGAMTSVDEGTAGGDADYNVAIGYNALEGGDFAGNDRQLQGNIAIGANAMDSTGANAQTGTVAIGQNALTALTSGADNLAIGYSALDAMTNGDGNLAIGRDALGNLNHTDANNNIAIGAYAGDAMGAYANMGNIFIGYAAGSGTFASASSENIAIGYLAMNSPLDDADGNIAIGALSLQDITQGDKNVSIGYYAGREITTGHSNVIIGGSALVNDTDGALSVVIGYQAGNGLTGSTENTIMGYNACGNFDATADNLAGVVAIGSHAFYGSGDTSDGANNTVAIGRDALKVLSTGGSNTAVGYQAMSETTQGSTNTVFGYRAMYRDAGLANTGNTFIGANAGNGDWTTTASTSNTGVGSGVMQGAMEGATNNTAVGLDGLQALTTGDNNSALGRTALGAVTTGVQNTAVGSFAGDTIQTGSNNTYIGRMTDASASSVANETAIGANATGQGSNTVTLGNADVTDIFMGSDKGAAVRADSNKIVCQGIEFPDTQSASGDDNILDDYEEGTWTPQVYYQNADDQSNVNYDTQVGFYTKIGNVVHIFLKLQWDATDARANDNFGFKNLPFTSKSTTDFHARGSVALSGITSTSITPLALIGANSTTVILVDMSTGSTTANMGNEIGEENNIEMSASLTYLV